MSFLDNLTWRYATKRFDGRKVSPEDLNKILEAIRMAPTSYGLQSFRVLIIENEGTKKELCLHAWDQDQVTSCSHLLIFCADSDVAGTAARQEKIGKELGLGDQGFDYQKEVIDMFKNMGADWVARQTYILLSFAMAACAELGIDSCPIEGFDPVAFDNILNLPAKLNSTLVLPIGYRSGEDKHASEPKIRAKKEDLFEFRQ